jgi:hypothetical protein
MPVRAKCSLFHAPAPEIPIKSMLFQGTDAVESISPAPDGALWGSRAVKAASGTRDLANLAYCVGHWAGLNHVWYGE